MSRRMKRPAPSVSVRKVRPVLLWSMIFAAARGSPFSSATTPVHSAESAHKIVAGVIPDNRAQRSASRAVERMCHRGTAGACCAFPKRSSFATVTALRAQEVCLRGDFGAFFDFGPRAGFGASEIQAGGSLAGNDSSEASSTGSGTCESSAGSRASRSSDFGAGEFCFLAGLVIRLRFYARSEEHTSGLQSPDHIVCPLLLV